VICLMRAPFDTKIIRFMRRAGRMEIEIDIMGEVVVIPVWILKAMNVDQEVVSSQGWKVRRHLRWHSFS